MLHVFRIDLDHDDRLSNDEVVSYVLKNIQEHLQKAQDRNLQLFLLIDNNENGEYIMDSHLNLI